jgi:hypothetical protein
MNMPKKNTIPEKLTNITYLHVDQLSNLEGNPRNITEKAFAQLKKSIKNDPEFLNLRPLLAKQEGENLIVYAGNQRLKACKELGIERVPVIIDNEATEEQIKKRILLDNVDFGSFNRYLVFEMYNTLELKEFDIPEIEDLVIEPVTIEKIELPSSSRSEFTQMTFTVTTMQKQVIEEALALAKQQEEFENTSNQNSNGNALAALASNYLEAN